MLWIYLILALSIGILAGTFTGLFPGIHINLIAIILLSLTFLANLDPLILIIFLVSMSITHTFIDYIPSIFLGAPDEDNFLSILPGHSFLLKGKAYQAIIYTLYGSAIAIPLTIIFSFIFIYTLNPIYEYVQRIIPYILILAALFLIYFEKKSKFLGIFIFILSGFLGLASFSLPLEQPLLPLFTGLFGISSLITSIMKKEKIPKQTITKLKNIRLGFKSIIKTLFASALASPLVSFLPGLGTSQAAIIGSEVVGDLDQKEFLFLLGSINTIVMGLSFTALYAVGKARTGTAVAISQLVTLSFSNLMYILATITITGFISFFSNNISSKNIFKTDP